MIVKTVVALTDSDVREALLKQIYATRPDLLKSAFNKIDVVYSLSQDDVACSATVTFSVDTREERYN